MFDNNYLFPFDTGLSHLSHQSHIFARAARTPNPTSPKKIALYSYTILTIYKRYRKSEQKAKNQRSINI